MTASRRPTETDLALIALNALQSLVERQSARENPEYPMDRNTLLSWAVEQYNIRIRRDKIFDAGLFGEPAWAILLDMFIAHLTDKRSSITSACARAMAPPTTALRWVHFLISQGILVSYPDERDKRRIWLELSTSALEGMCEIATSQTLGTAQSIENRPL